MDSIMATTSATLTQLNNERKSDVKIILLGDSAVGKSKLIERFLLNDFVPHQLSTYALTLYLHKCAHPTTPGQIITVEFWDTAGQERFQRMHPSYYAGAHCCILVFDITRKITYKNLETWYDEWIGHRGSGVPIIVCANKIDVDPSRAKKSFGFIQKIREARGEDEETPFYCGSASDGSNVVGMFKEAIKRAVKYKEFGAPPGKETFVDEVLRFMEEEERPGGLFSYEPEKQQEQVQI